MLPSFSYLNFKFSIDSSFETCIDSTSLIEGVSVKIDRSSTNEVVRITMFGPNDKWFGFGFGGITNKMDDSYAITIDGESANVRHRILGSSFSANRIGTEIHFNPSIMDIVIRNGRTTRSVTIYRPWTIDIDGIYDFRLLMECQFDAINMISAVGGSLEMGYHEDRGYGDIHRICSCDRHQICSEWKTSTECNAQSKCQWLRFLRICAGVIVTDSPTATSSSSDSQNTVNAVTVPTAEPDHCRGSFEDIPCRCFDEEQLCNEAILRGRTDCGWIRNIAFCGSFTFSPTSAPTISPTTGPSEQPTLMPSVPTRDPTNVPTENPSANPTSVPTENPSTNSTHRPSTELPVHSPIQTTIPSVEVITFPSFEPTTNPLFHRECDCESTDITVETVDHQLLGDVLHCYRYNLSVAALQPLMRDSSECAISMVSNWTFALPTECAQNDIELDGANKYLWSCSPHCHMHSDFGLSFR